MEVFVASYKKGNSEGWVNLIHSMIDRKIDQKGKDRQKEGIISREGGGAFVSRCL